MRTGGRVRDVRPWRDLLRAGIMRAARAPDRGFAASGVNYGTASKNAYTAGFLTGACPVVASYGGRDR
jgi:hypothetical protein